MTNKERAELIKTAIRDYKTRRIFGSYKRDLIRTAEISGRPQKCGNLRT